MICPPCQALGIHITSVTYIISNTTAVVQPVHFFFLDQGTSKKQSINVIVELAYLHKFQSFFETNKQKVLFKLLLFTSGEVKALLSRMSCNVLFQH